MLDFAAFLRENTIWHEFVEKEDMRSAAQAANVSGIPLDRIVKTLIFKIDGEFVIFMLQGSRTVDRRRIRALLGKENIALASHEEVLAITGYEVGAVPPIGLREKIPCIVDEPVSKFDTVWAGGGTKTRLVHLKVRDILQYHHPRVADISE